MTIEDVVLRPSVGGYPTQSPAAGEPCPAAPSAFSDYLRRRSVPLDTTSDAAVVLADPARLVLILIGAVDLFAARVAGGVPVGRWTPLCRLHAGAVLGPGALPGPGHVLIGRPVPGTTLSSLPLAELRALGGPPEVSIVAHPRRPKAGTHSGESGAHSADADTVDTADTAAAADESVAADETVAATDQLDILQACAEVLTGIETALDSLTRAMRHTLPPREFTPLEPCRRLQVAEGQVVRSVAGVLWVDIVEGSVTAGDAGSAATFRHRRPRLRHRARLVDRHHGHRAARATNLRTAAHRGVGESTAAQRLPFRLCGRPGGRGGAGEGEPSARFAPRQRAQVRCAGGRGLRPVGRFFGR